MTVGTYIVSTEGNIVTWLYPLLLGTMSCRCDGCSGRGGCNRGRSITLMLGHRWWSHFFPSKHKHKEMCNQPDGMSQYLPRNVTLCFEPGE